MTDELVPFADPIRLPAPADLKTQLREALSAHVSAVRNRRGEVHQQEDVNPLVRQLARATDVLKEYGVAFNSAATLAKKELDEELIAAVGEQDGVPMSGLTVPDTDGTDVHLSLQFTNSHDIDADQVISTVITAALAVTRGSAPEWVANPEDGDDLEQSWARYEERYEEWMAGVMRLAIDRVLELGTYSMQVSKVRAYQATLAGAGADDLAGVVRSSVKTTRRYGGTKMERKRRKE